MINCTNFFLVGDVENRARTLFNIPPSVKCRVWFVADKDGSKVLLTKADQQLADLDIWLLPDTFTLITTRIYHFKALGKFVLEKQNKDGRWSGI